MKKVLITGASGFAGGFLAEYLLSKNEYEIYGTYNRENTLQKSPVKDSISYHRLDLLDSHQTEEVVKKIHPDTIFHFAGAAPVASSFINPIQTMHVNIDSQINLLEAVRKAEITDAKIIIVSSAHVYGNINPSDLPIDEDTPFRPENPYAVSKIAQDYLGVQYFLSFGMDCIRVRPFNHIGPRQSTGFVVADFCKQIAEIEKGEKEPVIKVGNLDAKRDFTDVRDMVRAYFLLAEKGQKGDTYNIGTGESRSISSILDILLTLSEKKITVETDQSKMRPSDIADFYSDNTKITSLTGWKPEISIEQTLKETLDYWRNFI